MKHFVRCLVIVSLAAVLTACGDDKNFATTTSVVIEPISKEACNVVSDDEVRLVLDLPKALVTPDVVVGADNSIVCSWNVDPNLEGDASVPPLPPAFVRVNLLRSQTVSATYDRVELSSTGAVRVPNLGDRAIATVSAYGTQINVLQADTYVVGLAIRNDTTDSLPAEPLAALLRRVLERIAVAS